MHRKKSLPAYAPPLATLPGLGYNAGMKRRLPLLLLPSLLLVCCREGEEETPSALSPQEMYEKGRALLQPNVERNASDFAKALDWTRKAAEAGWRQAQTDLGGLYMYGGKGVSINGPEALRWFTRAAEQGSKAAEFYLGELYFRGLGGVKADDEAAIRHWRAAAEAGIAEAQQRLGYMLAQQRETFSEGLAWLKRAATEGTASGKAEAACNLGNIYATGKAGVQANMEEAARWYSIAAEEGDAKAQHVYALMLLTGDPVARDAEKGMFLLRRAASQDYLPAMADFIRRLRHAPDATAEQLKEAEAWNERLEKLMMERRTKTPAAAQPQPQAAE